MAVIFDLFFTSSFSNVSEAVYVDIGLFCAQLPGRVHNVEVFSQLKDQIFELNFYMSQLVQWKDYLVLTACLVKWFDHCRSQRKTWSSFFLIINFPILFWLNGFLSPGFDSRSSRSLSGATGDETLSLKFRREKMKKCWRKEIPENDRRYVSLGLLGGWVDLLQVISSVKAMTLIHCTEHTKTKGRVPKKNGKSVRLVRKILTLRTF